MKMSQEGWPLDQGPSQLDRCVRTIVVRCTSGQTACSSRRLILPVGRWSWDWQVVFGECTSEKVRIQCWSQHRLCMSGARKVTKVELKSGWRGVVLWFVSLQVKNTVTPMLQLRRAIQPVGSLFSTSSCWENDAYKVTLYQRCVPSSPSESDHWCDTLQHQIYSFSKIAGAALKCAYLVLALWKICVGDVGLLLVQRTTFSWKVRRTPSWYTSTTSCVFFFSWFLFDAAGLSLLPDRTGIQDDEIQRRKSKKESLSLIFGSTNFLQPWLPKFNVNYNKLKEGWQ